MSYSYPNPPPTFRSDSKSAALRFTSDDSVTQTGILMAYILSNYIILVFNRSARVLATWFPLCQ